MSQNSAASLAGGAAGAAIGFFTPVGPALGFSIGAAIGSALVPPQLPDQVGARLTDLDVSSSTFGQPVALLWGTNRVAGKMIFSSGKKETEIETEVGGKGGPTATQVSYTYSMDCAYVLGQLPPSASGMNVRKIWINSQLVYDYSETANAVSLEKSTKLASAVTVYDGSETQLPSSLQESYHGVGNVPAYRGLCIIEFDGLQLGQFGNGAVSVTAEVVIDPGTETIPVAINSWSGTDGGRTGQRDTCAAYDNGTIITAHDENIAPTSIDTWEHVVRRYDIEGNLLTEQRKTVNVGTFSSGVPDPRFTYNDPMMVASHGGGNKFRLSKFDGISPNGFAASENHPYNSVWNEGAWGKPNRHYKWLHWGDYFYVIGGDDLGGVRTTPNYLGRFPIISDITSPQFGYPTLDADVSVEIGNTYGQESHRLSLDVKNNRLYLVAATSGVWQITSWDTELNLLHRWQEPTVAIPTPVEGGLCLFSGDLILGKDIVDTTHRFYLYQFDPDVDDSTIAYVNDISPGGGAVNFDNIQPLTATLALTPRWILSLQPQQVQKTVGIATIISDMMTLVGAQASDYDVSSLTDTVDGYQAGDLLSARRAIEPLMTAFFIDAVEVDNKIVFIKRGGASVKTIGDDDLVRVGGALITKKRGSELELPKRVTLSYISQSSDYQVNEQHADRLVSVGSVGISNIALSVAFNDDDVPAQMADSLLYSTWAERDQITAYVSTKNIGLVPTDVVTLGSQALRVRINNVDTKLIGAIKLTGSIDYADSYLSSVTGGSSIASATMAGLEGPTITQLLDIPILREEDNGIIKYLGMSGVLAGWGGAVLYKSIDSGASYTNRAQALNGTIFGFTVGPFRDAGNTTTWDYTRNPTIRLASGALESASDLAVLNGANVAAVGDHGRWEIFQFAEATLQLDGSYILTKLLRGRRGTEHNTGNHVDSDRFILLTEAALVRLNDVAADIGQAYLYKGVSIGNNIQDSTAEAFTSAGQSITPFSPTYILGTRDGSNNLTTTWKRRDYGSYTANFTLPMSESTQSYELEYWNTALDTQYGGTKAATSETHSYTNAQQTSDGATPGQAFIVKIYQISAIVGRGHEGSEEI